MSVKIDTYTRRRGLEPRKTPYWVRVTVGHYVGFYRSADGGTWHARMLRDGKRVFEPLKGDIRSDYAEILKEAQKWFDQVGDPANARYTIKQCLADYVAHLRIENSEDSAKRTLQQLEKHLIPKLGHVEAAKLTTVRFKQWRDSLVRVSDDPEDVRKSKDSANKTLAMTKAALNLAFGQGIISSDTAWKRVSSFKGVTANRKLYLTDEQVAALLNETAGGFHLLVKAAILTGARYGELAGARVVDLDRVNGSLRLDGKTGARVSYLSDDALRFFKAIAWDRLPGAPLLAKDNGEKWSRGNHQRSMRAAITAAKLPHETVFYSLRHYHISKALLAGIPAQVVAENVGTSIRMLEKHYGKFMATDRRAMFNRVAIK